MNHSHLRAFLFVADCGSISSAAKELFITSTSLLQQINLLEEEVGFQLFHRSHRGVTLTASGEEFYAGSKKLLSDTDQLLARCRSIADSHALTISISVYKPYDFIHLTNAYGLKHPTVSFSYGRAEPLLIDRLSEHLTSGNFDLIQCEYHFCPPESEYDILPLAQDRLCCVLSPAHPLSKRSFIELSELNGQELFTFSNADSAIDRLDRTAARLGISIRITRALYSDYAVLKCCMDGNLYILEEKLARTLEGLSVVPLRPQIPFLHGVAHLRAPKPSVRAFLDYVRNTVHFPPEALEE